MINDRQTELLTLLQKADELAYLMIEAEGNDYRSYAEQLELLEIDIEQQKQELSDLWHGFKEYV